MIKVDQLKIRIDNNDPHILEAVLKKLRLKESDVNDIRILRRSVDARKKPELFYVYSILLSVSDEKGILKRFAKDPNVSLYEPVKYILPTLNSKETGKRPLIVGAGPSGLFCAYELALAGLCPIVIERGRCVEERRKDIEKYWKEGILDPRSNVQFGEGGAGTFSDGKLTTSIKDRYGRIGEVLRIFAENGAPENILYEHMPHIGTDLLCGIIKEIRQKIISLGGEVRFETTLTGIEEKGGFIKAALVADEKGNESTIDCDVLILATGHSARDTYRMLHKSGVVMSPKPFAAGFRVIHPQKLIDKSQYGDESYAEILGAAPYKLTAEFEERGIFSFCMCPGGYVVNSSSETGGMVVNGMSCSKRDSGYANSAIVVSIPVSDYGDAGPLSGIDYQEELEKRAYDISCGVIPVQRYGDFKASFGEPLNEKDFNSFDPFFEDFDPDKALKGRYSFSDLSGIFDDKINRIFVRGMEKFGNTINGFNDCRVLMAGVESRTSSPVRIERDENMNSSIAGLIPVGEGAGYAGGITSAAIDGIKAAEAVIFKYNN